MTTLLSDAEVDAKLEGENPPMPPALDDPIALADLLNPEERVLLDAAAELGVELTLLDANSHPVVGRAPAGLSLRPVTDVPFGSTLVSPTSMLHAGGREYLTTAVFHAAERLCTILAGPLPVASEGRARVLRLAHYLIRLAETLVTGGLRRALITRVHLAHVEEAYCELQQKTQRLEQAIARMKDADRVKANFLATVSHELRTPLTSVLGYSEMVLEGLAGPLTDEQRDYLQTVMSKGDQLLKLITTLLDVSRIESVGVQIDRSEVDVRELLRDILETLAPLGRRKRLAVRTEFIDPLSAIDGDRDKLRQVLLNLVGNAIKFTPERGEIRVTARDIDAPDTENAAKRRRYVEISVLDSGIGIPTHLHEKVFDAFYQVDNSATREYEGSGLGLAIVRKFVEAHNGRVWVENGPERGALFHVRLPAVIPSR